MNLEELKELMAKATPGPWEYESSECLKIKAPLGHTLCRMCWLTDKGRIDNAEGHANAALIVAMHNSLPELLHKAQIACEPCPDCEYNEQEANEAKSFSSDLIRILLKYFPEVTADPDYPEENLYSANEFDAVIRSAISALEARAERAEKYMEEVMDARDEENLAKCAALARAEKAEAVAECLAERLENNYYAADTKSGYLKEAAQEAAKRGEA